MHSLDANVAYNHAPGALPHGIRQRRNGTWKVSLRHPISGQKLSIGSFNCEGEAVSMRDLALMRIAQGDYSGGPCRVREQQLHTAAYPEFGSRKLLLPCGHEVVAPCLLAPPHNPAPRGQSDPTPHYWAPLPSPLPDPQRQSSKKRKDQISHISMPAGPSLPTAAYHGHERPASGVWHRSTHDPVGKPVGPGPEAARQLGYVCGPGPGGQVHAKRPDSWHLGCCLPTQAASPWMFVPGPDAAPSWRETQQSHAPYALPKLPAPTVVRRASMCSSAQSSCGSPMRRAFTAEAAAMPEVASSPCFLSGPRQESQDNMSGQPYQDTLQALNHSSQQISQLWLGTELSDAQLPMPVWQQGQKLYHDPKHPSTHISSQPPPQYLQAQPFPLFQQPPPKKKKIKLAQAVPPPLASPPYLALHPLPAPGHHASHPYPYPGYDAPPFSHLEHPHPPVAKMKKLRQAKQRRAFKGPATTAVSGDAMPVATSPIPENDLRVLPLVPAPVLSTLPLSPAPVLSRLLSSFGLDGIDLEAFLSECVQFRRASQPDGCSRAAEERPAGGAIEVLGVVSALSGPNTASTQRIYDVCGNKGLLSTDHGACAYVAVEKGGEKVPDAVPAAEGGPLGWIDADAAMLGKCFSMEGDGHVNRQVHREGGGQMQTTGALAAVAAAAFEMPELCFLYNDPQDLF